MAIRRGVHRSRLTMQVGAALALMGAACGDEPPPRGPAHGLPALGELAELPLGDVAGVDRGPLPAAATIANPYADDAGARRQGEQLFAAMNCVGCHGYGAQGGMGPDLTDSYWRYGGLPAQVFNSVYEGRPKGMPAYGKMLPPESIWRIATYLQSLQGLVSRREVLAEAGEGQRRGGSSQRTMKGNQSAGEK